MADPARKTALWISICQTLRSDIASGHYQPGDKLPTEAELSSRFGVNRHTVRRSLAALADEGLLHSRRGAGVFVAQKPTDYPLGKRVRFSRNLRAAGRLPSRKMLLIVTRKADETEARMLDISPESNVIACEAISLMDGQPLALARSIYPELRLPHMHEAMERLESVTEALADNGVHDYVRSFTRVNAKLATATQAAHLQIREGAPILQTISLNLDLHGSPIEYGQTWFAGDRITLTLSDDDVDD